MNNNIGFRIEPYSVSRFQVVDLSYQQVEIPFKVTLTSSNRMNRGDVKRIIDVVTTLCDFIIFDKDNGRAFPQDNRVQICPRFSDELNRPVIGIYGPYGGLDVGEDIKIEKTSSDVCEAVKVIFKDKSFFSIEYIRIKE